MTSLSIFCLILTIGVSFYREYGKADDYPLILNPNFKYFTRDSITGEYKPFLWEVTYTKGPNDLAFIRRDMIEGRGCLGIHLYQDGANDSYSWATSHVKQTLRGNSISQLFRSRIELLVYPTFSFVQDPVSKEPWNVFGLEINDGTHLIWFIFSDTKGGTYQIRNHRIVLLTVPLNQWSHVKIDVSNQYAEAGWDRPRDLSFILIAGATKMTVGNWAGYYSEIRLETK